MTKRTLLREAFLVALLIVIWGLALSCWRSLPERIPAHWDITGRPDRWTGPAGAFLHPAMATALYALTTFLPLLQRERRRLLGTLWFALFRLGVLGIPLVALLSACSHRIGASTDTVIPVVLGIALGLAGMTIWLANRRSQSPARSIGLSCVAGGLVVIVGAVVVPRWAILITIGAPQVLFVAILLLTRHERS